MMACEHGRNKTTNGALPATIVVSILGLFIILISVIGVAQATHAIFWSDTKLLTILTLQESFSHRV